MKLRNILKFRYVFSALAVSLVVLLAVCVIMFSPRLISYTYVAPPYEGATHVYLEIYDNTTIYFESLNRTALPCNATFQAYEGKTVNVNLQYFWIEGKQSRLLLQRTDPLTIREAP